MSLGLETSRDSIFEVLVLVSVMKLRVLVLVLKGQCLGLGLEHLRLDLGVCNAVQTRISGLRALLKLTSDTNTGPAQFGHMVYLMAAVLDPNYGFVWLDADHPGDDSVKKSLRETVTNAIVLEAEQCCSANLSGSDNERASTTTDKRVENAVAEGSTSEAPTPPLKKIDVVTVSLMCQLRMRN